MELEGAGLDPASANLIQRDWPLWGHIALFVVMIVLFFALYELLGFVVG